VRSGGEEPAFLSPAHLHDISTYIDILLRWNARINLTAIRNQEEIVTRHFGESLFAARMLFPARTRVGTAALGCPAERSSASLAADVATDAKGFRGRAALKGRVEAQEEKGALAPEANDEGPTANDRLSRLADLGSGAGFPGIPIKLWAPRISLTLIESNQKKATFLREVARALTLTDINIRNVRAQTLPPAQFDVVTLRAVERFTDALPVAARLLTPAGRLALLISSRQADQACAALRSFTWATPLPIPDSASRILLIGASS
jgi:16S rRNA (guanine(527)-N(7))-methyltransferase RsmG